MKYASGLLLFSVLVANDISAEALLDSMTAVISPENVKSTVLQVIQTSSGKERTFEYESFSSEKGKNVLLKYTKPKKVKGNAFLMKNNADDLWVYFPRTRRVRKLASHYKNQKVQGSDFSYEDFSGGETWKEDFNIKRLQDDDENYVLEFTPKPNVNSSYRSMTAYLQKSDYYPVKIEYFEKSGSHLKTLFLSEIKSVENIPTARVMEMVNHIEGTRTIMETIAITYDISFPDDFFTESNMRK